MYRVAAMTMKHLGETICKNLRAFRSARGGNVTLTFALAIVPIIGLVGAAVDYSRANSLRAALQSALDSTALMLSKEAPGLTSEQMTQKANAYFNAMFVQPEAKNLQIAASYNSATSTLTMTGTAHVDTTFSRIIGKDKMPIGTSTTIKWGMSRLRVALALDTTGSMSSAGKIDALKTATKGLLNTLKAAAINNGDVYVSIIPFSKDVNVGASNYNASWIDWTAWDAANAANSSNGWFCLLGWCWKDDVLVPQGTVPNHNTWNGCVTDRGTAAAPGTAVGYDQKVDPPVVGNAATLFPAEQYSECSAPIMGLSYDWTAMNTFVDSLYPAGNTNQPIGLVWAWQSLVGGGPLIAPPMDPTYPYNKIIILMSDGLNTQDRWYNGPGAAANVNGRMYNSAGAAGTCKNIKDAGITIYTVQVNTDGDPVSTLLQNCASDATKFFHLTSANQMVATFHQIGTNLAKLRIAK
jgi:Flp pilus assembly protein TadG